MITRELDPDIIRWGLHHLNFCCLSGGGGGSPRSITNYSKDQHSHEYVREGYNEMDRSNVENDEAIAHVLQDEFLRTAVSDPSGSLGGKRKKQRNGWIYVKKMKGRQKNRQDEGEKGKYTSSSSAGENSFNGNDISFLPKIADESTLDGEVGKRINQMVPVPHVPKINGKIPSVDEETSDHQLLMDRLQLYNLVELKISGDGNCQFRSLSDQIYRTDEHHKFVREQIVDQLSVHPEMYEGYVPMAFDDYVKKMRMVGEWGDHVTLQAAADVYGVKIFILTSFKDTCYIEILPHVQKSKRIIFLSFWAEVHYNSIYPQGGSDAQLS